MKYVLMILIFALVACNTIPDGPGTPSTTTVVHREPGHEPHAITEAGLKVGKRFVAETTKVWREYGWHGNNFGPCGMEPKVDEPCTQANATCKHNDINYICQQSQLTVYYGWVYSQNVATGEIKPLKDASVDIWNMPFCMIGACNALAGPVKTNEFGYYEIKASGIPTSSNVRAYKDGHYGVCKDKAPFCPGGLCSTGDTIKHDDVSLQPIPLKITTAQSCK